MPADISRLIDTLAAMKQQYLSDPTKAVRGSGFIYNLHRYCMEELCKAAGPKKIQMIDLSAMKKPTGKPHYPAVKIDPSKYQLMPEATLFGSHKNKDEDITLSHYANGPLIAVGVRSQMSSVAKNIENYYEGIIGECISLHDRFPMAVLGYVYLLPVNPIKAEREGEKVDLAKAERLYQKITERRDWRGPHDRYEHFAFIPVDFSTDPPALLETLPELSIETFFDRLVQTYNDRNLFNRL